jgi:uncharacterized protein
MPHSMKTNPGQKPTPVNSAYKIKLTEVPEDGREYTFNQATGELNSDLKDLIGDEKYDAQVFIKPLNHKDFSVVGRIRTATKEACSLCGETFSLKADLVVNEILIPQNSRKNERVEKIEKQVRSNHLSELSDAAAGVIEYHAEVFEVGTCLRQIVALSIPYKPIPQANKDGDCVVCFKSQLTNFNYDENMGEDVKKSPFEVLKGLKLNQ